VNWTIALNVFILQISRRQRSSVVGNPVHITEADATRQFCRVWRGDVNWAGIRGVSCRCNIWHWTRDSTRWVAGSTPCRPFRFELATSRKFFLRHVPLSPSSWSVCNSLPMKRQRCCSAGKVTVGLALHCFSVVTSVCCIYLDFGAWAWGHSPPFPSPLFPSLASVPLRSMPPLRLGGLG